MTFRSGCAALLFATLASVAPSVATAQIPDSAVPLQTVISETNTFRAEYAEYYNNKDAKALAGMYATNAIATFDNGTTAVGQKAIAEALAARAATLPHIVIKSDSLIAFGPTAIDVGTLTMHPAGGGEQVSRYLVVLRRNMQQWKIIRVAVVPVTK